MHTVADRGLEVPYVVVVFFLLDPHYNHFQSACVFVLNVSGLTCGVRAACL